MTVAHLFPTSVVLGDLRNARATLPIIELDRDKVERKRAHIRPLPDARETLSISAWSLYHAAKKAELACSFTVADIDHLAECFANEHHALFRWNGAELRLASGVTDIYESAAQASRARVIGEGMLLLAMQHEGYVFWDRLDLLIKRALRNESLKHPESVRRARIIRRQLGVQSDRKRSDFVIEKVTRGTALAEAKGSFVSPYSTSAIKSDLRQALNQLAATKRLVSPQPAKTFAVGTYLREVDDHHDEGSMIAVVDPEDRDASELGVTFPPDWVRRGNYAAWLVGMGFIEAAAALRDGHTREVETAALPLKRIGGIEFAYVVAGIQIRPEYRMLQMYFRDMLEWPDLWFGPWRECLQLRIIGLRVDVLAAISRALVVPQEESLLAIERLTVDIDDFGGFDGSIMADGTMCGVVAVDSMRDTEHADFAL